MVANVRTASENLTAALRARNRLVIYPRKIPPTAAEIAGCDLAILVWSDTVRAEAAAGAAGSCVIRW